MASSPPSPLQDAPLILFIPIAKVSCASADNAPWDILPLPNLFKISSIGSTSFILIGFLCFLNSNKSLILIGGKLWIPAEYFLYNSYEPLPTALCNKWISFPWYWWSSPLFLYLYKPPIGNVNTFFALNFSWSSLIFFSIPIIPIPDILEDIPGK